MGYLVVSSNYQNTTDLEKAYYEFFKICRMERLPVYIGIKKTNTVLEIKVRTCGHAGAQSVVSHPDLFPTSNALKSLKPFHTFWYQDLLFASTEAVLDPED